MRTRVENLEKETANLRRLLGELNKKVNNIKIPPPGADPEFVKKLSE